MLEKLSKKISQLNGSIISNERKLVLQPLIDYIQVRIDASEKIQLNFICTHNSRRSHLAQVWAQTCANYFGHNNVICFSGGTESTALFPVVAQTLEKAGFHISKENLAENPIYLISYSKNDEPIRCFSKKWNDESNPTSNFAAILTCSQADEDCPYIAGAEQRIAITYDDPKEFDNTPIQKEKYEERSNQIAMELAYVFSKLKK